MRTIIIHQILSSTKRCFVYSLALLLVLQLLACRKWLEKKPDTNFATPDTLNDLQALLDDSKTFNFNVPSMPEAGADNYFLTPAAYDNIKETDFYTAPYLWGTSPFSGTNDWGTGYYPVYVSNLCLERIEGIERNSSNTPQWNNVKGSALFFRAYYFLWLSWTYSKAFDTQTADTDLGIVLRNTSNINDKSTRSSVRQSYEQIISDAKAAADYLPNESIHPLRPSKAAAYALLARAYLSMRDYENALKYSDLALKIHGALINYNHDAEIAPDISVNLPFSRYNVETIFYSEMNSNYIIFSSGRIDSVLFEKYGGDDLRRKAFFRQVGSYQQFKGHYSQKDDVYFSGITTAELWLTRAECKARVGGGEKAGALSDLNTLLRNRYKEGIFQDKTANNVADALDTILLERRKELVMRGLRWMDIKRLNKEGRNIVLQRKVEGQIVTLQPNDNRYAFPIPQDIIDITGMQQNPR